MNPIGEYFPATIGARGTITVVVVLLLVALRLIRHLRARSIRKARSADISQASVNSDDNSRQLTSASRKQKSKRFQLPWARSYTAQVAGREIRERLRAKSIRIVTFMILAAVGAAVVIPVLTKAKAKTYEVGVVGPISRDTSVALAQATKATGTVARLASVVSKKTADQEVKSGKLDIAYECSAGILTNQAIAATDTSGKARLVRQLSLEIGIAEAFNEAKLSPSQIEAISRAKPVKVFSLQPPPKVTQSDRNTALLGIIVVFVMLNQYNTWTLIGVMEEKSSRVVAVLLSTIKPIQLLGGKVIGIGTVALAQAGLVIAFALALGKAVGSSLLSGTAPSMLAASLVWLLVGYAFYCWVYAAAGSMAERQDQVQTLAIPLSIPIVAAYVIALSTVSSAHPSLFTVVLGYIPLTAPLVMPVLVGIGHATWWELLVSVCISLASTVLVARFAATIYRRAVLRTRGRVRIRDVVRASNG